MVLFFFRYITHTFKQTENKTNLSTEDIYKLNKLARRGQLFGFKSSSIKELFDKSTKGHVLDYLFIAGGKEIGSWISPKVEFKIWVPIPFTTMITVTLNALLSDIVWAMD